MGIYQFKPEKSFLAKLYWQEAPPAAHGVPSGRLPRIGAVRNGDTPWAAEGWLHAGVDDFTRHDLPGYILSRRKFATQFWFGCYESDGEYDYEIRAAGVDDNHPHWSYANRCLDISRNGYLGLYTVSQSPGHDVLASRSMIWRLQGFAPDDLLAGSLHTGLELVSLHGKRVNRLVEDGFPYLNEQSGASGWLALELIRTAVPQP